MRRVRSAAAQKRFENIDLEGGAPPSPEERAGVDAFFAPEGPLSKVIPGYKRREGQVQLAEAVDEAITEGSVLLAEAPTGVGKSVGALAPALLRSAAQSPARTGARRRIIYATASIVLQEQLVSKDLPLVAKALGFPVTYALAKGLGNYLCLSALADAQGESATQRSLPIAGSSDAMWSAILRWANETRSGDVSELPFELPPALRARVTTSSDECVGRKCSHYDNCFGKRAKKAVEEVDVVVTNYHLLFAALMIGENVLPIGPDDVVVCDEAHRMVQIARDFFGFRLSHGSVRWATRLLRDTNRALQEEVLDESERYFQRLLEVRKDPNYKVRLRRAPTGTEEDLVRALVKARNALLLDSAEETLPSAQREKAGIAARKCAEITGWLRAAQKAADDEDNAFYVELAGAQGKERAALASKPVDVDRTIRARLFDAQHAVVMMSATLKTKDGRAGFEFVRKGAGAPEDAAVLEAPTPFDFDRNMLTVVPTGMPTPNEKRYHEAVAEALLEVVRRARGRTLALFTSYKGLEVVSRRLLDALAGQVEVLVQGTAPRLQLVERFKADVSSVLLGTESFWAGVDVPGEACSVVTIDRIPFANPDDPLLDMAKQRDPRGYFKEEVIPPALVQFRQGAGRLIRTETDRGVLVVFDQRVVEEGYGRQFLRALPTKNISRRISDVDAWLDGRLQREDLLR